MIPATTAAGAVEEAWTPCVCCANAPAAAASIKNWQEDQTHAGIKYAQHLACLQRCDPVDCAFHIEAIMPAFGLSRQLDLVTPACHSYLRVISRIVFVPRISRMSSRFTAVARRWSSEPMTFSTIGSILSRKLSKAAQFGYSTRIRMLKSCGLDASPFRIL